MGIYPNVGSGSSLQLYTCFRFEGILNLEPYTNKEESQLGQKSAIKLMLIWL